MLGVSQRGQEGQANDSGWAGGKRACKTAVQGAGLVRAVVLVLGAEQGVSSQHWEMLQKLVLVVQAAPAGPLG